MKLYTFLKQVLPSLTSRRHIVEKKESTHLESNLSWIQHKNKAANLPRFVERASPRDVYSEIPHTVRSNQVEVDVIFILLSITRPMMKPRSGEIDGTTVNRVRIRRSAMLFRETLGKKVRLVPRTVRVTWPDRSVAHKHNLRPNQGNSPWFWREHFSRYLPKLPSTSPTC